MVISLHYMKHYLTLKTQVKTQVKKRNKQQTFNKLQKEANGSHRSSQYQFPPYIIWTDWKPLYTHECFKLR